jgi:hypothetical protein
MQVPGENAMNKLSKEKQQQLILVILVTVMAGVGLWFGLIRTQKQSLQILAVKKQAAKERLQQVRKAIETADQTEQQLCELKKILDKSEEGMATGDLYSWSINTLRAFKLGYKVEIPQFSQVDGPKDATLLAAFPYKQATWTVAGTGSFYEFGKFVSDLENQFPYFRVLNMTLEPVSGLVSADGEKLAFKMDLAALVKPGAS